MKNKSVFIIRLIYYIIILIFLLYLFGKTPNGKIVLIPFLICFLINIIKYIVIITGKQRYVKWLNNIFLIVFFMSWFSFLSYFCYISFISKNYIMILFSIPFWIAGIIFLKNKSILCLWALIPKFL